MLWHVSEAIAQLRTALRAKEKEKEGINKAKVG